MKHSMTILRLLFLSLFIFIIFKGKPMLWFGVYAFSLLIALVFGRIYCGVICPMNTLMLATEWFSKKLNIQKYKIPRWLLSGKFAVFALFGSVLTLLLAQRVLQQRLPLLPAWIALSVIVTLFLPPVVFHHLICPFGVLQKLFGKKPRYSTRVVEEKCIGCKCCEEVCPSNAIVVQEESKKAMVDTALCLQCANCRQVCPKDAIHYMKK